MTAPWRWRGSSPNNITLLVWLLMAAAVAATPQFSSSTTAVEVYVSVTDRSGQPVRGLSQADFEVLEDGLPQQISAFTAGEFPLHVALAIDRSFSMAGTPLRVAKTASRGFLSALRPDDRSLVLGIGSEVTTVASDQVPRAGQVAAVEALDAWGTTRLHDAVVEAVDLTDAARGRRAVVIVSDGDDRYSEATAAAVIDRARRANVLIYPVALARQRPPLFAELASVTGGRSFHVRDLKRLEQTLRMIAADLREQYLLGYTPSRPLSASSANEWRAITVRVKRTGVTVRARDGYYVR